MRDECETCGDFHTGMEGCTKKAAATLSPSDTVPRQESGADKQREFEEAVAKHVAQFNGSYMKQVREESFRAGAAWEYWDGEAATLSIEILRLREERDEWKRRWEYSDTLHKREIEHRKAAETRLNDMDTRFAVAFEALEKIADPRKRDHREPDDYTEKCCMMEIANEALGGLSASGLGETGGKDG